MIKLATTANGNIIKVLDTDMTCYDVVGVMAGASTPKESIDDVVRYLENVNKV